MIPSSIALLYDRSLVVALCGLIFFLPISIALVETFATFAILIYIVKRFHLWRIRSRKDPGSRTGLVNFFQAFKPIPTPINFALGIFIIINLLSVVFSQDTRLSLQGFFLKLMESVLIFVAILEGMRTRRRIMIAVSLFLVAGGLAGIDGIFQYVTGRDFFLGYSMSEAGRVQASFKHANDYGTYLIFVLPIILGVLSSRFWADEFFQLFSLRLMKQNKGAGLWIRSGLILAFIGVFISLGLTYSRGAWAGFLGSLVLWACYKRTKLFMVATLVITFMLIFYLQFFISRPIMRYLGTAKKETGLLSDVQRLVGKTTGREGFWQEAVNIVKDYPWVGTGINTYSKVVANYKISWGAYPHNCYLQMAAETGILGLVSFLSMFFIFFWHSYKALRGINDEMISFLALGFLCGVFAFLVHGFFDTNFYSAKLANLSWIGMGFVFSLLGLEKS